VNQKENKKKNLHNKISGHLDTAESLLDQDKIQEVENHLKWIEAAKKIKTYRLEKTRLYWSILIALISIVIITLCIELTIPSTFISMELKANGIDVTLKNSENENTFKGSTFLANHIGIDQLTYFSDQPRELISLFNKQLDKVPFHCDIEGERVELKDMQSLRHDKNIRLSISTYKDTAQIYLNGFQLDGRLRVQPPGEISDGDGKIRTVKADRQINAPVSIFFRTKATKSNDIPIKINLKGKVNWDINNIKFLSLDFTEEDPPGSGERKPTIKSGYLKILEKGDEVAFRSGDYLFIKCMDCKKYELAGDGEQIRFSLQGKVSKIVGGTSDYEVDYMPSYLEYFYHNKKFAIIWGGLGIIWGFLWSVKKIFTWQ
jgi:hypothetical protein